MPKGAPLPEVTLSKEQYILKTNQQEGTQPPTNNDQKETSFNLPHPSVSSQMESSRNDEQVLTETNGSIADNLNTIGKHKMSPSPTQTQKTQPSPKKNKQEEITNNTNTSNTDDNKTKENKNQTTQMNKQEHITEQIITDDNTEQTEQTNKLSNIPKKNIIIPEITNNKITKTKKTTQKNSA